MSRSGFGKGGLIAHRGDVRRIGCEAADSSAYETQANARFELRRRIACLGGGAPDETRSRLAETRTPEGAPASAEDPALRPYEVDEAYPPHARTRACLRNLWAVIFPVGRSSVTRTVRVT